MVRTARRALKCNDYSAHPSSLVEIDNYSSNNGHFPLFPFPFSLFAVTFIESFNNVTFLLSCLSVVFTCPIPNIGTWPAEINVKVFGRKQYIVMPCWIILATSSPRNFYNHLITPCLPNSRRRLSLGSQLPSLESSLYTYPYDNTVCLRGEDVSLNSGN